MEGSMTATKEAIKESSSNFVHIVWPKIKQQIGGGYLIPIESVTDSKFADYLDTQSGIDAWQVLGNTDGIRGIASRVQVSKTQNPFNSFTVRYRLASGRETEYQKRMRAIKCTDRGLLFPFLTIQSFIDKEKKFLSAAVIKTVSLFESVMLCPDLWHKRVAPDGNVFIYAFWEDLQRNGYNIIIVDNSDIYDYKWREK
jgi:hypothetical protein